MKLDRGIFAIAATTMIVVAMLATVVVTVGVRATFVFQKRHEPSIDHWTSFSPPSGQFVASLPGPPVERFSQFSNGPSTVREVAFEDVRGVFKVQWQKVTPTVKQIKPMLENGLKTFLDRVNADNLVSLDASDASRDAIERAGHGHVNNTPVRFRCRVVYVNQTVIYVIWIGTVENAALLDVERFFGSFNCNNDTIVDRS